MAETEKKFEVKKMVPLTALGIFGVGLSLFCDSSRVQKFLLCQIRDIFGLWDEWNEQEEVEQILGDIPDGEERGVAGLINGAYRVNHRKIQRGRVKSHHVILDALRAARDIYSSGRRIK